MRRPLFAVGEVVLLVSKIYPEYNGEYVVEQIVSEPTDQACRITGKKLRWHASDAYGYFLNEPHYDHKGVGNKIASEHSELLWKEVALRKKHPPSEMSFTELMASLKQPITEEI